MGKLKTQRMKFEEIMKMFLCCWKGEYRRRKEDEVGENLLVIHHNNINDHQIASCLIRSSK